MPRRRLVLSSYSDGDEEEEDEQNQRQLHDAELEEEFRFQDAADDRQPLDPIPNFPEPVPISDDEFIDVSDTLTPPSPSPPEPASDDTFRQPPEVAPASSGCPVGDYLSRMGLRLKREWLDSCLRGIGSSVPGVDVAAKAKFCFEYFLVSDMNYCGGGVLPPNVDSMHLVDLSGPFVLQVDEIVNISSPLKGRYQDASSGIKRCLKLSMTDGVQRVFGMEYRPIKDLKVLAPAGLKVVICNVHIRHGLLMLVPEVLEVLGGMVSELDAARQRLINEVNKPPRGKRSRTGVAPTLATRATLAAWPQNGSNASGNTNGSSNVLGHTGSSSYVIGQSNGSVNVSGRSNNSTLQGATTIQANSQGANEVVPGTDTRQTVTEECAVPWSAQYTMPNPSSGVLSDFEEMHIDAPPVSGENAVSNQHSNTISDHEDLSMIDELEVEHPLILSGDREIPFTYLASLSAKWASMKEKAPSVQGKVKCFLTGVKGFQYKQRTMYELRVYVDDGSLISEILIDHNVVQKAIGYSPEEVTAALSSSDIKRVAEMKNTLRQFQIYLANFEGTMLIEINGTSPLPVALELSQGCTASDAWLLMRRLKPSPPAQTPRPPSMDPICISP